MIYYTLPGNDVMPMLGLGTFGLKGDQGAKTIELALDMGYRHLDTAATYENESAVGAGLKASGLAREDIFLTTKVDRSHLEQKDFIASCERSLSELKVDYVDLLLIHWPNAEVDIKKTFAAATKLVEAGKVKHFGVSNFIRQKLKEALDVACVPIAVNQVEFHPHLNQRELYRFCRKRSVLLTAYCPLGQGCVFDDPVLNDIANRYGRSVAQISLRWLLQKGIAVIPKSSSPVRLQENLKALEFELEDEDMELVENIGTVNRVIQWWPGEFDKDPGALGNDHYD